MNCANLPGVLREKYIIEFRRKSLKLRNAISTSALCMFNPCDLIDQRQIFFLSHFTTLLVANLDCIDSPHFPIMQRLAARASCCFWIGEL